MTNLEDNIKDLTERDTTKHEIAAEPLLAAAAAKASLTFCLLWILFYSLYVGFPYLSSGSESVYQAKINFEFSQNLFPPKTNAKKILIFGNSKVLTGFMPSAFDALSSEKGKPAISFNSGYPAREEFVPQLKKIIARRQIPNILILTNTWRSNKDSSIFHFLDDDHELAQRLFPFRNLIRDSLSFLATSRRHGGVQNFYAESRKNVEDMIEVNHGYYFISSQSLYPNNQLPDDFHLGTDDPSKVAFRSADIDSDEFKDLKRIVIDNRISCIFVPYYLRIGERSSPPNRNFSFASNIEANSPCRVLGPDYFLYPNRYFSDQTHLNPSGARAYTKDIYDLLNTINAL